MTLSSQAQADQAIRLANSGTTAEIDRFESDYGDALSSILDSLWDEAEEQGDSRMARRLQAAYTRLTGAE